MPKVRKNSGRSFRVGLARWLHRLNETDRKRSLKMKQSKFFVIASLAVVLTSSSAFACVSIGDPPKVDFAFESQSDELLKITMTTTQGQEHERLAIDDDDGFLTAYLIYGFLNKDGQAGLKGVEAERHKAAWLSQLKRLQTKFKSDDYKAELTRYLGGEHIYEKKARQLDQLVKSLGSDKKITADHLKAFSEFESGLGQVFSYEVKTVSGNASKPFRRKNFTAADFPNDITGIRFRSMSCGVANSNLGIIPLRADGGPGRGGNVAPGAFSTR